MVAPLPWIHLHDLLLDGCVHTTIHVLEISVMYMYLCLLVGFLAVASSSMHLLVKHFILLLFGLHALRGICYTTFSHYPYTPCSLILEDLYDDPYMFPCHEEHVPVFLFICRAFPSFIISQESSFKLRFHDRC